MMDYTNSALAEFVGLSPNHSGQRKHAIDRITPHCVVGQCTAEGLGEWFAKPSTKASANYGIDRDGRVGLYVEEKNRSWCSSSAANDQRAVTIECASDREEPYRMNDAVYDKLVRLCADICRRNGKAKLLWLGDRDRTLACKPADDEMVLTVHRWFAKKSCPGDWLYNRLGELAELVTAELGGGRAAVTAAPFLVRVEIPNLNIRTGPGTDFRAVGRFTGAGVFTVVETRPGKGSASGWGRLKSGAGWISLDYCVRV